LSIFVNTFSTKSFVNIKVKCAPLFVLSAHFTHYVKRVTTITSSSSESS